MPQPRRSRAKPAVIPEHTYLHPITVDIPMPTSTNRIWRRGINKKTGKATTYLNPKYELWKQEATAALRHQRIGKGWRTITGPFDVHLVLPLAKRFKIDMDNRIKATLDWCKQVGLIAEDKYQNRVVIEWGEAPEGLQITLTPAFVTN